LRNHPAVEKLSFSIGDAKSAQMQHDDFTPEEPDHFTTDETMSRSYSDNDVPAYDAEYDYA
jgi:hypothetical protein